MIPERLVPGTEEWDLYFLEHKQRYDFFAHQCTGRDVLDAACGIGYGTKILAEAGAARVLGVDIAGDAIAMAKQQFGHPAVSFLQKDVANLAGMGPFDVIVSFETIEHVPDPEFFLQAVRGVIRDDGLFVCSTPNPDHAGRNSEQNPYHLSEMPFVAFEALFARYFRIEERYHQSHSTAYLRYTGLIREVERLQKRVAFSRLLRLENRVRALLKREILADPKLPASLWTAAEDDYFIDKLDKPSSAPVTYILAGRPKL